MAQHHISGQFQVHTHTLPEGHPKLQSGRPGTIRELNQASGVRTARYMVYYAQKSSNFVSLNWHKEN